VLQSVIYMHRSQSLSAYSVAMWPLIAHSCNTFIDTWGCWTHQELQLGKISPSFLLSGYASTGKHTTADNCEWRICRTCRYLYSARY